MNADEESYVYRGNNEEFGETSSRYFVQDDDDDEVIPVDKY